MVPWSGNAGLSSAHQSRPLQRALSKVRKGAGGIVGLDLVTVKSPVLDPHTPGLASQPCHSQACDLGCDTLPLWASVSPFVKCRGGTCEL